MLKQFKRQLDVCDDVCQQIEQPGSKIFGVMIESHLNEGNQKLTPDVSLEYGKSITDGCIGWQDTERLLQKLADAVNG